MTPPQPRGIRAKAAAGAALLIAVLMLGALARTRWLTGDELSWDQSLSTVRNGTATTLATFATNAAQEAVGLVVLALGLVILWLRHRRWDAARLLGMAGAAWILALIVKRVISRPRPPTVLQLVTPDATPGFPSGHTTTAAVIVLIIAVVLYGTHRLWAAAAVTLAVIYALAVGISRLYLGDHYLTDVLASYLTVATAALLVSAVTDLRAVRTLTARLLRVPDVAEQPTTPKSSHLWAGSRRPPSTVE